MIASRAVKVYKLCNRYKEEYVTTVFSAEEAVMLGDRLISGELRSTGVRYRNLEGDIIKPLHRST